MSSISATASRLRTVFTIEAERLARECGVVRRVRKFSGASLAQTLVFGWLAHPEATLDELAQTAALCEASVSPQAVDSRFVASAGEFFRRLLEVATREVITSSPTAAELLDRFEGVYVQDSTVSALPDPLSRFWQGCGGARGQSRAGIKLHVRLDLKRGGLEGPWLDDARASDHDSPLDGTPLARGSLRLADLGFFDIALLARLNAAGTYWISRIQGHTAVFDLSGKRVDLPRLLRQAGPRIDRPVRVGIEAKLACRLVGVAAPAAVVRRRRARLRQDARRRGRAVSQRALQWCRWSVYITNVPVAKLSADETFVLARIRWQIELLIKLWKSVGGVGRSRSHRPERVLVELYAKLLAMVVQHWLLLACCWPAVNRSLYKASRAVRGWTKPLLVCLDRPRQFAAILRTLEQALRRCAKVQPRGRPAAYQLLQNPALIAR